MSKGDFRVQTAKMSRHTNGTDEFGSMKGQTKRGKNIDYLEDEFDSSAEMTAIETDGEEAEELYCGDCIFFESYNCIFRGKVDEDSDPVELKCTKYDD